ncbi:MAG: hypothetical protein ACW96X_04820 [Promethearchaeota archaeon]|jgi:hypothetical protein
MIRYLGNILSEEVNLTPPASAGLIRLAIKDEFGPFKLIGHLDFKDYKKSCENALKDRLKKLGVENIDQIIERIIDELIQHQSLITMEQV